MFDDNWFLFLLIIMLVFLQDGDLSQREIFVMLAILAALSMTNNLSSTSDDDTRNCFCNK